MNIICYGETICLLFGAFVMIASGQALILLLSLFGLLNMNIVLNISEYCISGL